VLAQLASGLLDQLQLLPQASREACAHGSARRLTIQSFDDSAALVGTRDVVTFLGVIVAHPMRVRAADQGTLADRARFCAAMSCSAGSRKSRSAVLGAIAIRFAMASCETTSLSVAAGNPATLAASESTRAILESALHWRSVAALSSCGSDALSFDTSRHGIAVRHRVCIGARINSAVRAAR
jgi:hypothetical protein